MFYTPRRVEAMGARSESIDHIRAQRRASENLHHVGVESTFTTKGHTSDVSPTLVGCKP